MSVWIQSWYRLLVKKNSAWLLYISLFNKSQALCNTHKEKEQLGLKWRKDTRHVIQKNSSIVLYRLKPLHVT